MFLDNLTTPSKSLVTFAQFPLPDAISKSYKADSKVKADDDNAEMYTPIEPDDKGFEAFIPPEPLKFKPVPQGPKLEDNVVYIIVEPASGLNCILA